MSLLQQTKLLKQFFPLKNQSLYSKIRINSTTWILEMLPCKRARILKYLNRRMEDKKYHRKMLIISRRCPMVYTNVLCHSCYGAINNREFYVSKQNQSKTKFYHLRCAQLKNII